jgi:hypothetical protein
MTGARLPGIDSLDYNIIEKHDELDRSLTDMLQNCADFRNEKLAMELLCEELNKLQPSRFILLTTPKFHCEIAGEGVE